MKREPVPTDNFPSSGSPEYWVSLEHLAQKPEVRAMMEREFPEGASTLDAPTRRTFLTVMSAAFGLMGLTACVRRPEEKIVPYTKSVEGVQPGVPQFYASALSNYGRAVGVLVESHEGRPTKVEGNPSHPMSRGKSDGYSQALVLDLYDPDRLTSAKSAGADSTWEKFEEALNGKLKSLEADGGSKLRVLTGFTTSPTFARLKGEVLKRFPKARFHEFESVSAHGRLAATKIAFGKACELTFALDKVKVVAAVDSDFLHTEPGAVVNAKLFSRARRVRKPGDAPARLYAVEPAFSTTGLTADERLRVPASHIESFLVALSAELAKLGAPLGGFGSKGAPGGFDPKFVTALAKDLWANKGAAAVMVGTRQPAATQALGLAINAALGNVGPVIQARESVEPAVLDHAADLKAFVTDAAAGKVDTLVILGANVAYGAPGDLDLAGALGKVGTKFYLGTHHDETSKLATWSAPRAHELESWGDLRGIDGTYTIVQPLIAPMFGGKTDIEVLAMMAKAHAPRGYDLVRETFASMGGKSAAAGTGHDTAPATSATAPASASASSSASASASASAPAAHSAHTGAAASGKSKTADVLDKIMDKLTGASASASASAAAASASVSASAVALASASAAAPVAAASASGGVGHGAPPSDMFAGGVEKAWKKALHDGLLANSHYALSTTPVNFEAVAAVVTGKKPELSAQSLELAFSADPALFDGRFANVSWMQELPHPVTKMAWDNAALISMKTAQALGLKSGDVARFTVNGKTADIPVWIVPGTADFSVQLHVGWGRKGIGRVAEGHGFDANPLRTTEGFYFVTGAKASPTNSVYELVVTQEHNMLEGRPIVREITPEGYAKNPEFTHQHMPTTLPLWTEKQYEGHKWGLIVDLTACTGCNACVVACQAENNIPSVGKMQVARQREMHWLRIDRYFSKASEKLSDLEAVDDCRAVAQPMMCQQCENAPCENVCPVNATTHSPEGLNEMVYNRCIGTRYCSNNCPYKARRFNFLDFHGEVPETTKMVSNPSVTVRMRGVMEKCTFCVQRISAGKLQSKLEKRPLRDGDIATACQQACPSDAIVFGDLNDKTSQAARLASAAHNYRVLDELLVKPRTNYLAKIRNRNGEIG